MAENSGIGWTTHTFNPWQGCNKVSQECKHCYIDALIRWQGKEPFNGPIRTKDWSKPFRWNRKAAITGERPRIFTCSMSDFFHPGADQWRDEAWEIIRNCPNLDWLILTKRPELIPDRLPSDWRWNNAWIDTVSICKSGFITTYYHSVSSACMPGALTTPHCPGGNAGPCGYFSH